MMNYFICIILVLTAAQCQCSESSDTAEEECELNWIEKILLFPYCMSDCSDMTKSPLELLENMDEKPAELQAEPIETEPELDSPEELCTETLETVEAVEEDIKSLFESNDPVEDVLAYILQTVLDFVQLGWDFIGGVLNKAFQQCVAAVNYLQDIASCAYYENTQTGLYEAFLSSWRHVIDEMAVAAEKLTDTLSIVPCGAPPENTTIWGCLWDTLDAYLGDVNGYILATVVTLIAILAVQFIKRKVLSGSESKHRNISSNSRVKKDNTVRPSKVTNSPRIDVVRKPVTGSPRKPLKSPGSVIGCQRRTKSELESREQQQQQNVPQVCPKRPPPPRPPPQPRLVDAGSDTMFITTTYSDINEATDTDDLRIAEKKTQSPCASQASPAMPACPVWIRYGSSPVKKHLEAKYGRKGRASSPIWERRASTDDDWQRSLLKKPRSPMRSPGKTRYVPSPIYIEKETNTSFDVDIGEPCCSSSFIEECLSESGGRSRRDSGDSSMHSLCLRPSVITKRYTKLKTGEFNMSHANGSGDTSAVLDVSELNKSISLYTGDGMVFYELAFVYAFQNIFTRIRELVRWSRWARTRKSFV